MATTLPGLAPFAQIFNRDYAVEYKRGPGGAVDPPPAAPPVLILTGGVQTLSTRTANTQGDGLGVTDSSMGIWMATTNLCVNGGMETNITGWSGVGGANLARDTAENKFGAASMSFTSPGAALSSAEFTVSGITPSSLATFSTWVKGVAGTTFRLVVVGIANGPDVVASGDWQRASLSFTSGVTGTEVVAIEHLAGQGPGVVFFVDGVQLEMRSIPTPYVETNGATAARVAGGIQADASLLTQAKGWMLIRARIHWNIRPYGTNGPAFVSYAVPGANPATFAWINCSGNTGNYSMVVSGQGSAQAVNGPIGDGVVITLIGTYDATAVRISMQGAPFVSGGPAVGLTGLTNLQIGSAGFAPDNRILDAEILTAAFGTGDLTDVEAKGLFDWLEANNDNQLVDRRNIPGGCTAFYSMVTTAGV